MLNINIKMSYNIISLFTNMFNQLYSTLLNIEFFNIPLLYIISSMIIASIMVSFLIRYIMK